MCNATKSGGDLCFHDFSPEAPHRGTLISHRSYIESCAREGSQPSNLFRCPGTLLDHLCIDSMHAGDLGAFQDALGGLMWLEINHKAWYRRQAIGLAHLNQDLTNYYKANQHLQLSSVVPLVIQ